MKPSLAKKALEASVKSRQPVFMWGPPGVGKSDVVRQTAESMGVDVVDIRAVLLDPVDLRGLPHVNGDKRAHWCPPAFLPYEPKSKGILFLDELNAAPPLTQAACYQLVLDRGLGEYRLPDGWAVVAAGNRETDRAVAHRMPSALANRFVHLDFTVDLEDWCTWAAKSHIRPEIVSFIQYRSNLLHQFDPKVDDKSFPTPRSWHMVSKMLDADVEKEVEFDVIRGAVGEGAAAELIGYLRVYRKLPDPMSIIANPKKAKVPDDIATKYAICGALAAFVTKKNFPKAYIYFDRLPAEFNVLAMRETYHRCPEIASNKEFVDWAADKIDILI